MFSNVFLLCCVHWTCLLISLLPCVSKNMTKSAWKWQHFLCGIFQLFIDYLVYFSPVQPLEQHCGTCLILTDMKERSANSQVWDSVCFVFHWFVMWVVAVKSNRSARWVERFPSDVDEDQCERDNVLKWDINIWVTEVQKNKQSHTLGSSVKPRSITQRV